MRWHVQYKGREYKCRLSKYELVYYEPGNDPYYILDIEGPTQGDEFYLYVDDVNEALDQLQEGYVTCLAEVHNLEEAEECKSKTL